MIGLRWLWQIEIYLRAFDRVADRAGKVGVEIGQLLALSAILIVMGFWRRTTGFLRHAYTANVAMMCAGFMLVGYQLTSYFIA